VCLWSCIIAVGADVLGIGSVYNSMPEKKRLEMIVPITKEAKKTTPISPAWRSLLRTRSRKLRVSGAMGRNKAITLLVMGWHFLC
jgi:hypothetical protein